MKAFTIHPPTPAVTGLVFLPFVPDAETQRLAACYDDGSVRLITYDREAGELVSQSVVLQLQERCRGLCVSANGSHLASWGKSVRVTSLGKTPREEDAALYPITSYCIPKTPEGDYHYRGFGLINNTVGVFCPGGPALTLSIQGSALSLVLSPDESMLGVGTQSSGLYVFELPSGKLIRRIESEVPITSITWLPDGQQVVYAESPRVSCASSAVCFVRTLNVQYGKLGTHTIVGAVQHLAVSPRSPVVIAVMKSTVCQYNLTTGAKVEHACVPPGVGGVSALAASPCGRYFALGMACGTIEMRRLAVLTS